jgi:hypothetical protein
MVSFRSRTFSIRQCTPKRHQFIALLTGHLDVLVPDLDAAEPAVLALGAAKHEHQAGTSFRVFVDPAGHPFCLCVN